MYKVDLDYIATDGRVYYKITKRFLWVFWIRQRGMLTRQGVEKFLEAMEFPS